MKNSYSRAVKRINSIDTKHYLNISHKRYRDIRSKGEYTADATLIAEYYRRVGVLLQFVNIEGVSILMGMSRLIHKEPFLDYDNLLTICPNLKEINLTIFKVICFNYLEWCCLIDKGNAIAIKYHDIYEPIIKLFERGGGQISIHHHELVGGFGAFPRSISASRGDMKEFDISDNALDLEIKEIEHAEAFLKGYLFDRNVTSNCIRCRTRLLVEENQSIGGTWYNIKCETEKCFDDNFSSYYFE
ncbi:hypothetical protein [Paenibacillus elgii]|uniref:hypothetical protein n=1 Tax=Paenibacillus elgii TaxID=189691 RepID=UPI000FDBAD66|nr:hypothetical protein [Paenibacillus elgii]NEN82592.1 hypothetical protein [Paenibacillus elgii]